MTHPTPSAVNARGVGVTNIGRAPNALSTRKTESEATKKLKPVSPVVEITDPETVNLHATIGIEGDNFSGEDNNGLDFPNLAADDAPEIPTNIDSINYETVLKSPEAR